MGPGRAVLRAALGGGAERGARGRGGGDGGGGAAIFHVVPREGAGEDAGAVCRGRATIGVERALCRRQRPDTFRRRRDPRRLRAHRRLAGIRARLVPALHGDGVGGIGVARAARGRAEAGRKLAGAVVDQGGSVGQDFSGLHVARGPRGTGVGAEDEQEGTAESSRQASLTSRRGIHQRVALLSFSFSFSGSSSRLPKKSGSTDDGTSSLRLSCHRTTRA